MPDPAANRVTAPIDHSLLDPALCLAADVLDDIERVRIANGNRVGQMTRSVEDSDGEVRGFGYNPEHPDVVRLVEIVENLKLLEHKATLELQRKMRKHPLGAYQKTHLGVGEKQLARLLAAIGDPYINGAKDAPRTVGALWAYCGLDPRDGQARKRRKGERANWSTKAKTLAWRIADKCKQTIDTSCRDAGYPHYGRDGHEAADAQLAGAVPAQDHPQDQAGRTGCGGHSSIAGLACGCSPYRVVYDRRRAHTAITHPEWTDGHSHNDGLRIASKAILKDLWRAARDWHLTQQETAMTDPTPMPIPPAGPPSIPGPKAA